MARRSREFFFSRGAFHGCRGGNAISRPGYVEDAVVAVA